MGNPHEMVPAIVGIGTGDAHRIVTNAEIAANIRAENAVSGGNPNRPSDAAFNRLMERVGIEQRRWVEPGQTTTSLGLEAANGALAMAGEPASAIRTIRVATSTAQHTYIPESARLQHELGLPTNIRAIDVAGACTGLVQGIDDAMREVYEKSGIQLVVGSEVLSIAINPKAQETYPVFGDGAGAVAINLVKPDEEKPVKSGRSFGSDGSKWEDLYFPGGGSAHPATHETVEGNMHTLWMNGDRVKELAVEHMAQRAVEALVDADNFPIEELDWLFPHNANKEIIEKTAAALNFPMEKVLFDSLAQDGNTSAASIARAMRIAYDQGKLKRNDKILMVTFGAGIVSAGLFLPMYGLPENGEKRVF